MTRLKNYKEVTKAKSAGSVPSRQRQCAKRDGIDRLNKSSAVEAAVRQWNRFNGTLGSISDEHSTL
jgi:hypothetical protein